MRILADEQGQYVLDILHNKVRIGDRVVYNKGRRRGNLTVAVLKTIKTSTSTEFRLEGEPLVSHTSTAQFYIENPKYGWEKGPRTPHYFIKVSA